MKVLKMKKAFILLGLVLLSLVLFVSEGFTWNAATHVYIDDHLYKKQGLTNTDELYNRLYGGNGPDVFNYMFNKYFFYLYPQTHNNFMALWENASTETEKALAYGFVSHNDVWGADSTAHHSGKTYGHGEGYIIAKAQVLKSILQQVPEFNALGLPDNIALEVAHNFVESGVDILMKRLDPSIGEKLMTSATYRSNEFPTLLVNAYADGLSETFGISLEDAAETISFTENEYRKSLIAYGYVLTLDDATAMHLISEQTAELAPGFLAMYGVTLSVPPAALVPLVEFGISTSIEICADDFEGEIRATTGWVNGNLSSNGITY